MHTVRKIYLDILLGQGDKIITDIHGDGWSGIAVSAGEAEIGEFIDTGAKKVGDLDPLVTIVADNLKSLNVIIEACERAKEHLIKQGII